MITIKNIKKYFVKITEDAIRYQGFHNTEVISLMIANELAKHCFYDKKQKALIFKISDK